MTAVGAAVRRVEVRARIAVHGDGPVATRLLGAGRVGRRALLSGPLSPWLVRRAQRRSRHRIAAPQVPPGSVESLDTAAVVESLERDGVAAGIRLDPAVVADLRAWWAEHPGARRLADPHLQSELVDRVFHDPELLAVARGYLGAEPIALETVMHVVPPDRSDEPDRNTVGYHFENSDVRALMVYLYLSDVGPHGGPHQAVAGTHRHKHPREMLRFMQPEQEVLQRYGRERLVTLIGARGSGFFEDNAVLHRRMPTTTPRLTLTLVYTLQRERADGACGHYSRHSASSILLPDRSEPEPSVDAGSPPA